MSAVLAPYADAITLTVAFTGAGMIGFILGALLGGDLPGRRS